MVRFSDPGGGGFPSRRLSAPGDAQLSARRLSDPKAAAADARLLDARLADARRPETKLADAHLSDREKLEKWKLGRVSRISERRVPDPESEEPIWRDNNGVPPVSQRRTSLEAARSSLEAARQGCTLLHFPRQPELCFLSLKP